MLNIKVIDTSKIKYANITKMFFLSNTYYFNNIKNIDLAVYIENKANQSEKLIIRYSMRFMKLLHFYITEFGSKYNTADRVTKLYINQEDIDLIKYGENYRLVTWNLSSGETKKSEEFKDGYNMPSSIQIYIEKNNKNAGVIDGAEISDSIYLNDTLISAYSLYSTKRNAEGNIDLILANDDSSIIEKSKVL